MRQRDEDQEHRQRKPRGAPCGEDEVGGGEEVEHEEEAGEGLGAAATEAVEFFFGDEDGWAAVAGVGGVGANSLADGVAVGAHEGEYADEKPDEGVGDSQAREALEPERGAVGEGQAKGLGAFFAPAEDEGGGNDGEIEEGEEGDAGGPFGVEEGFGVKVEECGKVDEQVEEEGKGG